MLKATGTNILCLVPSASCLVRMSRGGQRANMTDARSPYGRPVLPTRLPQRTPSAPPGFANGATLMQSRGSSPASHLDYMLR